MELALAEAYATDKPNLAAIARKYDVGRSALSCQFRGKTTSMRVKLENMQALNKHEEKCVLDWIAELTDQGVPPRPSMVMDFASTLAGRQLGQHWVTRFMARHKADSATSNKTWEPRTPIVAREPQHLHSARPATGYGTFSKAHKIRSFVNRVSAGCSPGQRKAFKYLGYHYTKLLANHTAMLARIEQLEKANSEKTRSRQRALTVIEQMGAVQSQPGVFMDDETAELRRELLEQREEVKRQQQAITAARKEAVAQKKADKEPQIQQRREARAAAIIARNAASAAKKAAKAAKQAQKEADLESKPSQAGKRFALRTKNGDTAARSVAATTAVEVPLAALTTRSGRVSVRPSHKRT